MQNTYSDFIQNILDDRGRFSCGDEYHERHHIVPKCIGGTNDENNLIDLFAREHFIAHKLLAVENPDNKNLVFAWTCMAFPSNKYQHRLEVCSEEYEEAKKAISEIMSGRTFSQETKNKMSEAGKRNPAAMKNIKKATEVIRGVPLTEKHKENISKALKGRMFTDEHKANISKAKAGKPQSDAQKAALSKVCESNKGRKRSEEAKAKTSAALKGRVFTQETLDKMSESHKGKSNSHLYKKIAQYDLDGITLIKIWDCIMDASRWTDIDNSCIAKCAKGEQKTAGGFVWKFI